MLLIDEDDLGTLDDESSRQRFIDEIFELKVMFTKIILITHLEDVAEQHLSLPRLKRVI